MSIRSRLAIAVGLILMVMLVVLGVATVTLTSNILHDRVEQQIVEQLDDIQRQIDEGGWLNWDELAKPGPQFSPNPVAIGVLYIGSDFAWIQESGYNYDPDLPPIIPQFGTTGFQKLVEEPVELYSGDGEHAYLVQAYAIKPAKTAPDSATLGYVVIGAPLDGVKTTIASLTRWLLIGGVLALVMSTTAVWLVIRQGLRPVEKMIDTADQIARGDLSQRVPESAIDPHTELGRLGGALNEMLGQIEHSSQLRDQSEARLRQFIADAAHELRTPLTSLRGYAELYRQGALQNDDSVRNAMQRIESEGTRMARLVDELLLLARLDQQPGPELHRVDLAQLCREAVADFRVVDPDRPVHEQLQSSAMVLGDRLQLRQIIDNLLTNVRVHTPGGTSVTVRVQTIGTNVQLVVSDTGPGIAADDQKHIFERFWRGDRSRARRTGSSGLGLSIVASLVEKHSGQITVQSTPGKGSSFTVLFPVATERSERSAAHEGAPQQPDLVSSTTTS